MLLQPDMGCAPAVPLRVPPDRGRVERPGGESGPARPDSSEVRSAAGPSQCPAPGATGGLAPVAPPGGRVGVAQPFVHRVAAGGAGHRARSSPWTRRRASALSSPRPRRPWAEGRRWPCPRCSPASLPATLTEAPRGRWRLPAADGAEFRPWTANHASPARLRPHHVAQLRRIPAILIRQSGQDP